MQDLIRIEKRACEPTANCYHVWRLEVGQDLFGLWIARVTYRGGGARLRVQRGLRRQTSIRRLGVA